MTRRGGRFVVVLVGVMGLLVAASVAAADEAGAVKPSPQDKCPVCGMFVAKYGNWVAEIVFVDGTYALFDGPKDMFKYYFNIPEYQKGKTKRDVKQIFVTEYYTTRLIAAADAYFIVGSDVYGPMGEELVPVQGKEEAEEFMKDHRGTRMLTFDQVTPADIPAMPKMRRHGHQ